MRAVRDWSKPRTLKEDWKLSQVSWDQIRPWTTRPPLIFFQSPRQLVALSGSQSQSCCVTPLLHWALLNSCAQHQDPRVWLLPWSFSPLQDQTLTSPSPQLSISRSLADINSMSELQERSGSVKPTGGREGFIMEQNYLAVHWGAAWHGLSSQTALPPLIAVLIAGAVLAFISQAASHSAQTQMIKWPSQLPPLPIKRLQGACEIKEG